MFTQKGGGGGGGAPIYVVSSNFVTKIYLATETENEIKKLPHRAAEWFLSGASVDISRVTRNLTFCSRYSLGSRQTEIEGTA